MSELLKDVMNQQATEAGEPEVDLAAIIATGDRRIRRRRVAVGVVATAAVVAAAVAGPAVIDHDALSRHRTPPATGGFETRKPTYAIGSTIYYGNDAIEVSPHTVTALVQTDDGFVFTSPKGDHQDVYWTDATTTRRIGETSAADTPGTVLAADDSGPYAAWVDTGGTPAPEFVVYDTSTGKEVARTSEGNKPVADQADEFDLPVVHAIDGDTAYWHSSAGTVADDVKSGKQQLIKPHTSPSYLFDVSAGVFAHASFDDLATVVSRDIAATKPFVPGIGEPLLSPTAAYVATTPQQSTSIWDVNLGTDVTPKPLRFETALLTQWVSPDSYVAVASQDSNLYTGPVALVECSVADGSCSSVNADIGRFDQLAFPVGGSLTDR